MKATSLRHLRRRENLSALVKTCGGPTALARLVGTPKTHISALLSGSRGMGDALAKKIEAATWRTEGWMDEDHSPKGQAWKQIAYAHLGAVRDRMTEAEVLAVQRFLGPPTF